MKDEDSPPIEYIRIEDCTFEHGRVITLGSEATIVRDVVVDNCRFIGPMSVLNFELRPDTPQRYEDIHYRNITLDSDGGRLLHVSPWTQYFNLKGQQPPKSLLRDITLENIRGRYGSFGVVEGNRGQTQITGLTLAKIDVQLEHSGLRAVNVEDLNIKNVVVNGKPYLLKVPGRPSRSLSKSTRGFQKLNWESTDHDVRAGHERNDRTSLAFIKTVVSPELSRCGLEEKRAGCQ